jgi:chorismate mutase / prephenate dehydratase
MPVSALQKPTTSQQTRALPTGLSRCRQRINDLDDTLVALLHQRSHLSVTIARLKRQAGLPLRTPAREGEILRQVKNAARAPLSAAGLERIFRAILAEMRLAQRRTTRKKAV